MRSRDCEPPWPFVLALVVAAPVVFPVVLVVETWAWVYRVLFEPPNRPWTPSLGE